MHAYESQQSDSIQPENTCQTRESEYVHAMNYVMSDFESLYNMSLLCHLWWGSHKVN